MTIFLPAKSICSKVLIQSRDFRLRREHRHGNVFFKWLYPKALIMSFEADPTTFAVLQRNIQRNHLQDVTRTMSRYGAKMATSRSL